MGRNTRGDCVASEDPHIRQGATAALRNTHDPSAITGLAEAVNDTDQEVRYLGVAGLGEITGQNEWTPSTDTFAREEEKYLQHWRAWLASRKDANVTAGCGR